MITGNEPIQPEQIVADQHGNIYQQTGYSRNSGLTIRQHFAAIAMQGLVGKMNVHDYKDLAEYSVRAADALIQELNK